MTGHWDKWQYNDRNELTHADRFEGEAPYENNPLPAMLRRYAYDPIGNRIESAVGNPADPNDPIESVYMRNELNQYLQVKTVQTQAGQGLRFDADGNLVEMFLAGDVNRDGVLGAGDIAAMSAAYGKCAGEAGYNPYADLNGDGCVTLADWSELMGLYGYAIGDGVWASYTWDAENRLICVAPPSGEEEPGDKKIEFKYDYMGRRVEKRVYTWQYVTDHYDWVDSDCRRFVYYNWLPLLELQVTNPYSPGVAGSQGQGGGGSQGQGGAGSPSAETVTILRKYTWGLDLAGQNGSVNSIDSAGGIGGLLACYDTNGTTGGANPTADDKQYIYFYDANGNVGQVIDWTNAAVSPPSTAWSAARLVATYEYDPYGNVTASAGAYAAANPFRFSTKYWDDETGLGYWGYRYYSPRLGRWGSRDPVGERDSFNEHSALRNSSAYWVDPDGRQSISFPGVGPVGPDRPREWPPGVPYPPVPAPPATPQHVAPHDSLQLWCSEYALGMCHCDVKCVSTTGTGLTGGGTGPASSGGHTGPGGNPGWRDKPRIPQGARFAGETFAPSGTCDCLRRKAAKLNQIPDKLYELPCMPTTSNSNAALSTLLRCCGVSLSPKSYIGCSTPGWGDDVLYQCGSKMVLAAIVLGSDPLAPGNATKHSVPCFCPVTCEMLQ